MRLRAAGWRKRRRAKRLARLRVDLPERCEASGAPGLNLRDTCLRQLLIGDALALAGLYVRARGSSSGVPEMDGAWYDPGSPAMN